MASPESIAIRRYHANESIKASIPALGDLFGIEMPPAPSFYRHDPDFAAMQQTEYMSVTLQHILDSLTKDAADPRCADALDELRRAKANQPPKKSKE